MMWGYHWGLGWGWAMVGGLMMFAFWGAIVWLLWGVLTRGPRVPGDEDPREIADRRLAAGQITADEHALIVARLKG